VFPSRSRNERPRLLIVDDDPVLLGALPDLFSMKMPYLHVDVCETPGEALNVMTRITCDAVISDLRMPEMNGLDLLAEARRRGLTFLFLFMTGSGDYTLAVEAFERGAHDFILKPFERDELVRSARKAIRLQRLLERVEGNPAIPCGARGANGLPTRTENRSGPRPSPVVTELLLARDNVLAQINASVDRLKRQLRTMETHNQRLLHSLRATEEQARRTARWRLERLRTASHPPM